MQHNSSFGGFPRLLWDNLAVVAHVLHMAIVSPNDRDNPKLLGAVLLPLRTQCYTLRTVKSLPEIWNVTQNLVWGPGKTWVQHWANLTLWDLKQVASRLWAQWLQLGGWLLYPGAAAAALLWCSLAPVACREPLSLTLLVYLRPALPHVGSTLQGWPVTPACGAFDSPSPCW